MATSACASPAPSDPEPTESSENPYGGFPVDPPADDEIVLSIDGEPGSDLTYRELQERATVTHDIVEPFVNRAESFTGVPLRELADEAGLSGQETVVTIALNGYEYSDTVAALTEADALVAVFRDGELIPMDEGGPIRLVYPVGSTYYEFLDAWNWSLRSVVIATTP